MPSDPSVDYAGGAVEFSGDRRQPRGHGLENHKGACVVKCRQDKDVACVGKKPPVLWLVLETQQYHLSCKLFTSR